MILDQLSNAPGVSGNEEPVRQIILKAIKPHVDEWRVDTLGNVLALKKAAPGAPAFKVMLDAHMDEVGLMITGHDSSGGLRFKTVGGIDARILPGKSLRIGPDQIPGVIGAKPIHLTDEREENQVVKVEAMLIDIGASSREEAEKAVEIGQYANFATRYRRLGRVVTGKAFDDRAGCAVLVELLSRERFNFELHAAFTVQEEVGLRGARVAAFAIEPDCAFILEGTVCDDLPKDKDLSPTTELGKGPAISIMDRSLFVSRPMLDHVVNTAKAAGIPYQFKQPGIGGTDGGATTRSKAGVPSLPVSVPCRYIHSPVSMMALADFRNTVRLMRESLARLTPDVVRNA
ncbi:MAG: M42 family metallopeptidase [Thermoflexales bacterium]|nr:M42 family metallopeptidase [Thermoflexales bacterium]